MALEIPSGFGQAVAQFGFTLGQSNPLAMVFGYENPNASSAATQAQSIGDEVASVFGTSIFTDQVIFQQLSVIQNPGQQTGLAVYNQAGGNGSPSTPPNTCLLVHKTTTLGGRQGRGRMYWPSLSTADINEAGVINPASLASFTTNMNNFLLGLTAAFAPMYLLHTSPVLAPTQVTALVVDPIAATQRRRMRS